MIKKTGVLLINLGTPDDPSPKAVYRYLKQFLNDPRVIDLPGAARFLLTNVVIVPFRYKKSAAAYQKIWSDGQSPLLTNSLNLQKALSQQLGATYQVEISMRYGNPSIQSVLDKMPSCDKIIILPLFPQYSSAATGSAIEEVMTQLKHRWNMPDIIIQKDFYDEAGFIAAYAELIQGAMSAHKIDHLLFSYHGLPERHIQRSLCQASCDHVHACPKMSADNAFCYRAQCYATTESLAQKLSLTPAFYSVGFQSRLGKTPWIKPYSDHCLPLLRKQGIKNLAIVCPSFVADCLETLEEVNMRAREDWMRLGGEQFHFIPCINDSATWVNALSEKVRKIALG